jgi:hypothetical protein
VTASHHKTNHRLSQLSRQELVAFGKAIVIERLEKLGCTGEDAEQSDRRQTRRGDSLAPLARGFRVHSAAGRVRFLDEAAIHACEQPVRGNRAFG